MRRLWNGPNLLSLGRILLIPLIIIFMNVDRIAFAWLAAGCFALAGVTDVIDGILARQRQDTTEVGYFLDPLADKILYQSILVTLVTLDHVPSWVVIAIMLILSREISIGALLGMAFKQGMNLSHSLLDKYCNLVQFIAILSILLYKTEILDFLLPLGLTLLVITVMISLSSALKYSVVFARKMTKVSP